MVVCLELSAHLLDQPAERAADRRHAPLVGPKRGAAAGAGGRRAEHSGIPDNGQFPNTMPTFAPNGYQQLGSPMNTASDFSTSVTRDCRFADLAERPAHAEDGPRLALGAAQCRPAAVADRAVHVQHRRQRPARCRGHRQSVRELPARAGADLRDRLPAVGRFRNAPTFRNTSSRTTGRYPTG